MTYMVTCGSRQRVTKFGHTTSAHLRKPQRCRLKAKQKRRYRQPGEVTKRDSLDVAPIRWDGCTHIYKIYHNAPLRITLSYPTQLVFFRRGLGPCKHYIWSMVQPDHTSKASSLSRQPQVLSLLIIRHRVSEQTFNVITTYSTTAGRNSCRFRPTWTANSLTPTQHAQCGVNKDTQARAP